MYLRTDDCTLTTCFYKLRYIRKLQIENTTPKMIYYRGWLCKIFADAIPAI